MSRLRSLTQFIPQSVRFHARQLAFFGTRFRCPLCNSNIRAWHDYGSNAPVLVERHVVGHVRRAQASCPVCHGKDRARLIQLYLREVAGVGDRPLRILDIAPEYGLHLWIKSQARVAYTPSDFDAYRYRHIPELVQADLMDLPFPDASFDVVICSHVLEHVPDDRQSMREIRRVLADDGVGLLLVPEATDGGDTDEDTTLADPRAREARFGQWDHLRLYARDDFDRRLQAAGLAVERYNPGAANAAIAEAHGLNRLEWLRVVRRAAAVAPVEAEPALAAD